MTGDYIHGASFAMPFSNVDFITWRQNVDTKEYWMKLHTMSGKEIRIQASYEELNDILAAFSSKMHRTENRKIVYRSDNYELDNHKQ